MAVPGGIALAQTKGGRQAAAPGFPGVAYRDYSRCLPDYLRDLAANAYQMREREMAKLAGREAVRVRQKWVRETFWKLIGGMPERTPLIPAGSEAASRHRQRQGFLRNLFARVRIQRLGGISKAPEVVRGPGGSRPARLGRNSFAAWPRL